MNFSGSIFQDKKESASLLSVYTHDAKNTSSKRTIFYTLSELAGN
jgi:hypothetical protein